MGVAKVTVNNVVKVDLTSDTVAADKLLSDYTAHGADGEAITGTYAGGGVAAESDVNFRDYDGTLIKSYSAAEFANVTELPANPSHTGLTAQGWNWSLSDAKTYVANYGGLEIGQMYITDDEKTRLYITLDDPNALSIGMYFSANTTYYAFIDFGDDSGEHQVYGSNLYSKQVIEHTYTSTGDYVITLWPYSSSDKVGLYVGESSTSFLFYFKNGVYSTSNINYLITSLRILKKVELGRIDLISSYAFNCCHELETITMPINIGHTDMYTGVFYECISLKYITIPTSITSISNYYLFQKCRSLKGISLPNSLTSITCTYMFDGCYSLERLTIPSNVTTFYGNNNLNDAHALKELIIPDSVQSLSSASSLCRNCYSLKKVHLPANETAISLPQSVFDSCTALRSVTIPSNFTTFGSYAFSSTGSLGKMVIPSGISTIPSSCFSSSYGLSNINIPATVTSILSYAFSNCYGLQAIHFQGSTPPTVNSSNTFTNLNRYCKIYVPSGSLSSYTSATNYPSSSTYTYIEE